MIGTARSSWPGSELRCAVLTDGGGVAGCFARLSVVSIGAAEVTTSSPSL